MTRTNPDSKAQGDLKAAFDEMLASLAAARAGAPPRRAGLGMLRIAT